MNGYNFFQGYETAGSASAPYGMVEILGQLSIRTADGQQVPYEVRFIESGRAEVLFAYSSGKQAELTARWRFPKRDVSGMWHPDVRKDRSILADFTKSLHSMTAISAPVLCLYSSRSVNRFTFAFSEVRQPVDFSCYIHEEDACFVPEIRLQVPPSSADEPGRSYRIYMDVRAVPYGQAIAEVSDWWESSSASSPMPVPAAAREPVYSTWYSYHQGVSAEDIERECRLAGEIGCRTVIVDDGWQCDDTSRDYAFCGDWDFSAGKFPAVREHVQKVHECGMKYMIWISVPFLGRRSRKWERFCDRLLCEIPELQAGVLDIRYAEIRSDLVETYETLAREYDLDGFKLDFIDEFYEREGTPAANDAMDCQCIQEALDRLMLELREKLLAFKPDFLIEFRQKYIGPNMRNYGNMFRVVDCPGAADSNRVGIVDLRLLSGNTAVHSDMILWHPGESPEQAALHLLPCIFGTVQISVPLTEIPKEHLDMLRFWLSFLREHRETLLESRLIPLDPQYLYPVITARGAKEQIIAGYQSGRIIPVSSLRDGTRTYLINGTDSETMVVDLERLDAAYFRCRNCFGQTVWEDSMISPGTSGLMEFQVPAAGMLEIIL